MTVRNIRAHQSRGLLPAAPGSRTAPGSTAPTTSRADRADPRAAGGRLQARGDRPAARQRRRLERRGAALHPRGQGPVRGRDSPQIVTAAELAERWDAGDAAPALLRKAEKLGILRPLPDGNFEELSPRLGRRALSSPRSGSRPRPRSRSPPTCASTPTRSRRPSSTLFIRQVWKPFEDQGQPRARPPRRSRRDRAAAPACLRRAAGDVPARDDRGGRGADRPRGRADREARARRADAAPVEQPLADRRRVEARRARSRR